MDAIRWLRQIDPCRAYRIVGTWRDGELVNVLTLFEVEVGIVVVGRIGCDGVDCMRTRRGRQFFASDRGGIRNDELPSWSYPISCAFTLSATNVATGVVTAYWLAPATMM
jgi:hypothetical protein